MAEPGAKTPDPNSSLQIQELDGLLSLAERYEEKLERARPLVFVCFAAGLLAALAAVATALYALRSALTEPSPVRGYAEAAIATGIVSVMAALTSSQILLLYGDRRRDRKAMFEVISIVRETVQILSDTQGWNALQRETFRIRLSRLEVGRASTHADVRAAIPVAKVGYLHRLFSDGIGIDMGTANTLVYVRDLGIVLREPSIVAVKSGTNMVLAVGNEAKRLLGRAPANIVAIRPIKDGVIADFDVAEAMLRYFISRVHTRAKWVKPRVVIAVSYGSSEAEKRNFRHAAIQAGARDVDLIVAPMAAALGVGLPVQDQAANMIVHIGGGTTEIAVIQLSTIVFGSSIRVGGGKMDDAIVNYVKRAYNLMIGERTAEEIKIKIGSAFPPESADKEMTMEIKGRDLVAGLPRTLTITSQEVREALMEPVSTIIDSVRDTLLRCPPQVSADLLDRGVVLVGGGALLRGLDELLKQDTGLPIHIAEDPMSAVAEGTGKVVNERR